LDSISSGILGQRLKVTESQRFKIFATFLCLNILSQADFADKADLRYFKIFNLSARSAESA